MSRAKRSKLTVPDFMRKVSCPSAGAARKEGDQVITLSPFEVLIAGEESLAVLMAQEKGIIFSHKIPLHITKNSENGRAWLKDTLEKEYERYQKDGWFPENFEPKQAVTNLENSASQAISAIAKEQTRPRSQMPHGR